MSGTRVPFDTSLPFVVACGELSCGTRSFKRGDAFPWRDLGLTEIDLLQLWLHHKVDVDMLERQLADPASRAQESASVAQRFSHERKRRARR